MKKKKNYTGTNNEGKLREIKNLTKNIQIFSTLDFKFKSQRKTVKLCTKFDYKI